MKQYTSIAEVEAVADSRTYSSYIDEFGEVVNVTKYYLDGVQIWTQIG